MKRETRVTEARVITLERDLLRYGTLTILGDVSDGRALVASGRAEWVKPDLVIRLKEPVDRASDSA